jgi:hypothetical protein
MTLDVECAQVMKIFEIGLISKVTSCAVISLTREIEKYMYSRNY